MFNALLHTEKKEKNQQNMNQYNFKNLVLRWVCVIW